MCTDSSHPTGEHLYCGLRRCRAYLLPWPLRGFRLHLLWHHPQRHAHLHPVQQIFWLLRQVKGAGVQSFKHRAHLPAHETPKAQFQQLLRTSARELRWWDILSALREANHPRGRGLSKDANLLTLLTPKRPYHLWVQKVQDPICLQLWACVV